MAAPHDENAAFKHQVHVLSWVREDMTKPLKCFRCLRWLPVEAYAPLFGTKYARGIRGKAGAGSYRVNYLHPWCHGCKKQARGIHAKHPLYSPDLDRFWSKRLSAIKASVHLRGVLCLLDKQDLLGKCLEQDNLCAITRQPMTFEMKGYRNKYMQASVDRIDSSMNYEIGNIQIVCNIVNLMKHDMPTPEFYRWCDLILNGRRRAEDDLLNAIG